MKNYSGKRQGLDPEEVERKTAGWNPYKADPYYGRHYVKVSDTTPCNAPICACRGTNVKRHNIPKEGIWKPSTWETHGYTSTITPARCPECTADMPFYGNCRFCASPPKPVEEISTPAPETPKPRVLRPKLTIDQVVEIKEMLGKGITGVEIARKFGISSQRVYKIKAGKHYKNR